jgi:methylated-DNA-[protein]-cysteine S-methyltransferase
MQAPCARIPTPFGDLTVNVADGVIVASAFGSRRPAAPQRISDPLLREVRRQVRAYLAKKLVRFDLPLELRGTPFQIAVWQLVSQLETGELVSYADVARAIGRPHAHRGVALAMAQTPLDLFIPAHRVVGADGRVKGAGPKSLRRKLLAFEGIHLS